jgi:hypothetical protein
MGSPFKNAMLSCEESPNRLFAHCPKLSYFRYGVVPFQSNGMQLGWPNGLLFLYFWSHYEKTPGGLTPQDQQPVSPINRRRTLTNLIPQS